VRIISADYEKRDVTWRIVPRFGLILIFFGAIGSVLGQNPKSEESTPVQADTSRGKRIFEAKCSTCHGLDGRGGEHAPDIIRRLAAKALSDQALLNLIHDGLDEEGMPGFPSLSPDDGRAVVAYMRLLQGKSAAGSVAGDPVRGKDLFFGKAGCSACHQVGGGQFVAWDLAGFGRDRPANEIRDAILRPRREQPESATAVGRDGRKFSGMVRNEDNASLQLQGKDGRFYLLMKSSLVSVQRKTGDSMPADYGKRLSAAELDDLVGYILHEAHAGRDEEPHAQN
jgi:putative heme-binding domain-containing protein